LSLRQDGIQKVLNGVTTIEEVLRVTQKWWQKAWGVAHSVKKGW